MTNDHTSFGRRKKILSKLTLWLALACPIHGSVVFGQENTRNGAVLGGLAGAVVGGVVGHNHKDQTAEGALIGGAVGAVAGGLVGNQRDRYERQREAYERQRQAYERQRQQFYQQQTYAQPYGYVGQPTVIVGTPAVVPRGVPQRLAPVRRPVSTDEVVHMVRSGVSENVIVAQLQTNGVVTRPDVNEVIRLSQEGVSEYVITAMQTVDVVPITGPYNSTPSRSAIPASSRMTTNRVPTSSGGHIPSTSSRSVPYNSPTYTTPTYSNPPSSGAWNTTPRFAPPPLLERRGY
ncbi:MAG: glycine zipper 2TM domain-containing protein [Planctomycetota bacterium]|nr:MAG: glycine zipper 2TM domain-containing protein [Planctomycetota bacterium]